MLRTISLEIGEVLALAPALLHQGIPQQPRIPQGSIRRVTLRRPNIEPHPRPPSQLGRLDKSDNRPVVPPDGRRHDRKLAESARESQPKRQRNQRSQRRPTDTRTLRIRPRPIFRIDKGLEFFHQQLAIAPPVPRVLVYALLARIVDSDN